MKSSEEIALEEILEEYKDAVATWPKFASAHEGISILKEEVDELWDEVKKKPSKRSIKSLRAEAVQIAAMALRFITDVCE